MKEEFNRAGKIFADNAHHVLFGLLATGNITLGLGHGYHADLVTAAGLSWFASDIALLFKRHHPVAVPRLNAAGVAIGAFLLAASPVHGSLTGTLPAAAIVAARTEIFKLGRLLSEKDNWLVKAPGHVLRHPYAIAAGVNTWFGLRKMWESAQGPHPDHRVMTACVLYTLGMAVMPLLDKRVSNEPQIT